MKKNILYISAILAISLLTGCSSDEKNENKTTAKEATASSIETVENKHSLEIKVQEKEHDNKDKQYYFDYDVKSAYSQNARPANKDASVRVKPRTVVDANLHVRSPYEKVQISMLVSELSKDFIIKCSACHNDYANGLIGPSLLGKDQTVILKKINKFKNDKTANVLMYDLLNNMTEDEINKIALEISNFNKEIQKMRGKK